MKPTRSSCAPAFHPPSPKPSPRADLAGFVASVLAPNEPVLVAVSGGGDSTALLLLLAPIARAQGRRLVAGIVDHALREGSAADAAQAAAIAADLGATPALLELAWPSGPRTAQAPARRARYAALAELARREGAATLFLGHTLDDQAETVLIRQEAGSGPRGLSAMAPLSPCPIWPEGRDLQLARPLLDHRREALRDLLRAQGVRWIEDPANALARYTRVRARAALQASGNTPCLADLARRQAAEAAADDRIASEWLDRHATCDEDRFLLEGAPPPRALSAIATAAGGAPREPSLEAVARLAARLAAGEPGTLAGARFRPGSRLIVTRDPGGVLGRRGGGERLAPLALPAGEPVAWDGRLELRAAKPGWVASPPARGQPLRPILRGGAGQPPAERWLLADRVRQLLWRANCCLFTAP